MPKTNTTTGKEQRFADVEIYVNESTGKYGYDGNVKIPVSDNPKQVLAAILDWPADSIEIGESILDIPGDFAAYLN